MKTIAWALQAVIAAFDKLEIRYAVGGSVASSLHGHYRFTNNVDFLVELRANHIEEFVKLLGPEFYADADMMRESFSLGRPCNLIHMKSGFKFDLFPAFRESFSDSQLNRRTFEISDFLGEPIEFAVTSAEDVLLSKLRWYRLGGESSEQQWKDVLGIVSVHGSRLDRAYLQHWATDLGVDDLLVRLIREKGEG